MKKMNPVIHFEMPYEDNKRMMDFYSRAFGWQAKALGEKMGTYVLVTTSEPDEKGFPKKPGMINGGFYPKKEDWPAQYPSLVISVDDIRKQSKKSWNPEVKYWVSRWKFPATACTSPSLIWKAIG